jgi:hypothetical protein
MHSYNPERIDDTPLAQRRTRREIKLPERYEPKAFLVEDPETHEIIQAFALDESEEILLDEPTLRQAMTSSKWPEWQAAIHQELASLKEMGTYDDIDALPPGRKAVGSKWVLLIKRDENGEISRYKARLVALGYAQIQGQDYNYTFAPVARWDSIRLVLSLTAIHDWELRHIDIKTAYLNGVLKEDIYMRRPEILGPGYWHLKKTIYGLKQSGREWYADLNQTYASIGFTRCETDWSIHHRIGGDRISITATSVDDILHASNSKAESDLFLTEIKSKYQITDNGDVHWLLGCKITRWRTRGCLKLDQERYVISILEAYKMTACNSVAVPMIDRLTSDMSPKTEEEMREAKTLPYKELVGKLMYLATCTRPDIAFTVRELAKYMSNYGVHHWKAAKHLLRYLQGTRSHGILYGHRDDPYPIFRTFTDSDWAQGESRKSVCGYVVEMGGGAIAWSSKQQAIVATSSCEAEYVASAHAAKQVLWLRSITQELGFTQKAPTPLYCDNQGTIACTHDPQHHSKMKHIDIRYHFIRDCVSKKLIDVLYIPGVQNVADLLTKPLPRIIHAKWVDRLRMDSGQGGVLMDDVTT